MFAKSIIDSDLFLDMPQSSQCLYFHLSMRADDEGFVNSPKKIQRMIGASDDDCRLLITNRFLIPFDTGVVVIRHWRIHNYIQKDRFKNTMYQAERSALSCDETGAYQLMDTECIHDVSIWETQVRLGKDRLGKSSLGEDKKVRKRTPAPFVPPTLQEVEEYAKSRNSSVDPKRFFEYFDVGNWVDGKGNPVKNWKQKFITWERSGTGQRREKAPPKSTAPGQDFNPSPDRLQRNADWLDKFLEEQEGKV